MATTKPSWPTVKHEINTTRLPNSPGGTDTWVDVTDRVLTFDTKRGRTDELADVQTGVMNWKLRNADGRFDPANSASDLYPNLRPNRQARTTVTWAGTSYPIFYGYEEKGWPMAYSMLGGRYGTCDASFVDAIGPLGTITLPDIMTSDLLHFAPLALYAFTETSGLSAVSTAGAAQPTLDFTVNGGATVSLGSTPTPIPVAPEQGMTGLAMALTNTTTSSVTARAVIAGLAGSTPYVSMCFWISVTGTITSIVTLGGGGTSYYGTTGVALSSSGADLVVRAYQPSGTGTLVLTGKADGKPHFINIITGGSNVSVTVDGTVQSLGLASSLDSTQLSTLTINPAMTAGTSAGISLGFLAVYGLAGDNSSVAYPDGLKAGAGDTDRNRYDRVLTGIAWLNSMRANRGPFLPHDLITLQQVSSYAGSTALSQLQTAVDSTNATLDIDTLGRVRYSHRDYRTLQTTPAVTFGEFAGEVPYKNDLLIGVDPTFLYSTIELDQVNGVTLLRSDANSVLELFAKTLVKSTSLSSIGVIGDFAAMYLRLYKAGLQRVQKITVEPSMHPAMWPQVLALDFGSRVRVNRRQAGAPTKTLDCYIENITHTVTADSWQMSFLMSPVPTATPFTWGTSSWGDGSIWTA